MNISSRILCVDDNQDSREMITLMLSYADDGYTVTSASSVEEALALIEKQPFDLYILDNRFSDTTGIELCTKIRQTDKQVPVLFFSALAREIDRRQATEAGANEYLVKPNDLERLTETVRKLLDKSSLDIIGNK